MIGVDLTKISRFKNKNDNFAKRILSKTELDFYSKIPDEADKKYFLAKCWAIKEAIFKADNNYSIFSKIDLKTDESTFAHKDFYISTSSEGDYIVAFVMKK